MTNAVAIFSVDNVDELRSLRKFTKYIDQLKAMNKLQGDPKLCFGMYKGVMEQSFIMTLQDFLWYVRTTPWFQGQEAYMVVDEGHKGVMYASMVSKSDQWTPLGRLIEVTQQTAFEKSGWTYRPDMNTFWIVED